MNKLLLAIVCLTANTTFGQIKKKDMLLGGTFGVSFNSDNINPYSQSNTNIDPLFQWSYKDNRTLGFALGLSYFNYSINDGSRQESLAMVPSVNFTQYHPVKGRWGWYLQEGVGAGFQTTTNTNSVGDKVKSTAVLVSGGVRPGVYIMPGDASRWLLFGSVGGADVSYRDQKDGPTNWSFNLNLFRYYQFGFALLINKREP